MIKILLKKHKETYRSGHNGADSKSVSRATGTGVRIPPSPLKDEWWESTTFFIHSFLNMFKFLVATSRKMAILI